MEFIDELRFLKEQLKFKERFELPKHFDNVVMAGMGGSGISNKIFQEMYTEKPLFLIDDYEIPNFVSKSTLFIAISYSGTTEETVNAVQSAIKKGAHVVTISSGGTLSELGDQRIKIPRNDLQPRSAMGYMLLPLMRSFGMVKDSDIEETYDLLSKLDSDHKDATRHAQDIKKLDSVPVIYGAMPYRNVAYRWKTQFNENSKIIAYSSYFPELNHNDTLALAKTYRKKDFYFMVFESEDKRIAKRIRVTEKITNSSFNMIRLVGKSSLAKLFYLLHYGDYVSYELALLRGIDPAEVELLLTLKRAMKDQKS